MLNVAVIGSMIDTTTTNQTTPEVANRDPEVDATIDGTIEETAAAMTEETTDVTSLTSATMTTVTGMDEHLQLQASVSS